MLPTPEFLPTSHLTQVRIPITQAPIVGSGERAASLTASMPPTVLLTATWLVTHKPIPLFNCYIALYQARRRSTTAFLINKDLTGCTLSFMTNLLAVVYPTTKDLPTDLCTCWNWIQAVLSYSFQLCLTTIARLNPLWQIFTLPTGTWMTNLATIMIATRESVLA